MRIPRGSVHPSVWAARDRFQSRALGGEASTPEETKIYSAHQELWFKQNGVTFIVGCLAFFAMVALLASLKHSMPRPVFVMAMLGVMGACGGGIALGMRGSRRYVDSAELRLVMPALRLTPIQEAYGEALLALSELKLDVGAYEELLAQFNALLDEEARILALRNRGPVRNSRADVLAERDRLLERLAVTSDPVSRDALERSLQICEGRVASSQDLSMIGERADAQLEMIAQSMRNFRDTLQRLQSAPVQSTFNIDPIRDTIRQAQQHAQALEAAVREVERA